MTTYFETKADAEVALSQAIKSGVMQGGLVYKDTLSERDHGLIRYVADGYHGSHQWRL